MALTKEDLQAIQQLLEPINTRLDSMEQGQKDTNARLDGIDKKQETHTQAIMNLENSVMHELKMLNELLPDALAKREAFEDVSAKVENHGDRIFALEQKVATG